MTKLARIDARLAEIEEMYPDEGMAPADVLAEHARLCGERRAIVRPAERRANRARMRAEEAASRPVTAAVNAFLRSTR